MKENGAAYRIELVIIIMIKNDINKIYMYIIYIYVCVSVKELLMAFGVVLTSWGHWHRVHACAKINTLRLCGDFTGTNGTKATGKTDRSPTFSGHFSFLFFFFLFFCCIPLRLRCPTGPKSPWKCNATNRSSNSLNCWGSFFFFTISERVQ